MSIKPPNLLLAGLSVRLIFAVIIIVALWTGLLWATSSPGGL